MLVRLADHVQLGPSLIQLVSTVSPFRKEGVLFAFAQCALPPGSTSVACTLQVNLGHRTDQQQQQTMFTMGRKNGETC